jgi:prevent-host-death family protein
MNDFNVSEDIIPIGEFKRNISKWFKKIQTTGHPLIITQNGRPAGVLISPMEYDELIHKKLFFESIKRGLSDVESENVYTTKEMKEELKKRRAERNTK